MEMQPVKSEMLSHVGYDPESNTLRARFKNGGMDYDYKDVTAEDHAALLAAHSIGKHFRDHILSRSKGVRIPGERAS